MVSHCPQTKGINLTGIKIRITINSLKKNTQTNISMWELVAAFQRKDSIRIKPTGCLSFSKLISQGISSPVCTKTELNGIV